ncbi:MAG: FAD-linked oxidase C-terminal domain-containing protein, partial [Pacificimonas sp.]
YVLVEATSSAAGTAQRAALERTLALALEDDEIEDAAIAESEAQRADFWRLRETIAEAERVDGPALKHDIAVPVAKMPAFIERVGDAIEARWAGTSIFAFGHLGDGNVHFNVRSDDSLARDRLLLLKDEVASFVHDEVRAQGGSISAEHGIGTQKAGELARLGDPGKLTAMRAVKVALDPNGIMNPGKLFAT